MQSTHPGFTELIAHIGRAETVCIAIAAQRGWPIAPNEKKRVLQATRGSSRARVNRAAAPGAAAAPSAQVLRQRFE